MINGFFNGLELGLAAAGFIIPSMNIGYSIGAWLGLTLFGAIQGAMVLWIFRKFIKGGF